MTTILILTAIPVALAAAFDSVGFGLLAVAGVIWAAALGVCTVAAVVSGRGKAVNETISSTLSTIAAAIAIAGLIVIVTA